MTVKRKVRPNLTNYDVLELVQNELYQSEKRIIRKVMIIVSTGVLVLILFLVLVTLNQSNMAQYNAAEAMRKAFEAERTIQFIDEPTGTNFLGQSKQK